MNKQRTETIDGVVYYVWKAGDALPDYQPIECKWNSPCFGFISEHEHFSTWRWCDRRWPKLVNDRARHQRMIDEAFEKIKDADRYQTFLQLATAFHLFFCSSNTDEFMIHAVESSALLKRMMEHVQAEIDKESEVNT